MMKNKLTDLIVLILFLSLSVLAQPLTANNLENIEITKAGDSVLVKITTSDAAEYNAFLTEEKPERIVVDLAGVTNDFKTREFMSLACNTIASVRTSQFQVDPSLVARVVLDIGRSVGFNNYRSANSIYIKLPAVAGESEFAAWAANNDFIAPEPKTPTPAAPPPVEVASASPETEPVAQSIPTPVETKVEEKTAVSETADEVPAVAEVAQADESSEELAEEAEDDPTANQAIDPPSGIKLDPYPTRSLVSYGTGSIRDPFLPLIRAGNKHGSDRLPVIENLKLVGVLTDSRGNKALLESAEGEGYILAPNDRIQNGYLVTVTDNKAIFQITEYGWTRTVALELDIPEIN